MKDSIRDQIMISIGVIIFCLLVVITINSPPTQADYLLTALYSLLIAFALVFGIQLSGGEASL
ncbi:MAG: hypothetical protein P1S60_19770, partial [Anaerolineae bacterium]|nr:hypothetical protein [Anaerolineae bacterium]